LVWLHANRGQIPRSRAIYEGAAEPMRVIHARERPKSAGNGISIDHIDIPARPRNWSMDEREISGLGLMDLNRIDSGISESLPVSSSPQSSVSVKEMLLHVKKSEQRWLDEPNIPIFNYFITERTRSRDEKIEA